MEGHAPSCPKMFFNSLFTTYRKHRLTTAPAPWFDPEFGMSNNGIGRPSGNDRDLPLDDKRPAAVSTSPPEAGKLRMTTNRS